MLRITIPSRELFDENSSTFISVKETSIQLEHSLVSISKWESKWKKPYLVRENNKTPEEFIDYIRCMTITQNVDPLVYYGLSDDNLKDIQAYIDDTMSARNINKNKNQRGSREIITSELIYYYMFSFNIPMECQKWHINRLLSLIDLFSIKNQPKKKMSKAEIIERNRVLNKERRERLNTKG